MVLYIMGTLSEKENIMNIWLIKKISVSIVLTCFLACTTSFAMNCYPQHSIPHEEVVRFTELSQELELQNIHTAIQDGGTFVDTLVERETILQTLLDPVNRVVAFCHAIDEKDREKTEKASVLQQLQTTKMMIIKKLFIFYQKVKTKLGGDALRIIKENEIAPKIVEIFGII